MVDRDKMVGLIQRLRQYIRYLQDLAGLDEDRFLEDPMAVGSARYYLQVSVESCINLANHIIAAQRLRAPQDFKDTFRVLNEAGIVPDDCAARMRELAGLRNLLVHLYWEVDDRLILEGIRTELGHFEVFVSHIMAHVDRSSPAAGS
jgi:uncharacterized protein YutE (UPF0331/DUF86 family)